MSRCRRLQLCGVFTPQRCLLCIQNFFQSLLYGIFRLFLFFLRIFHFQILFLLMYQALGLREQYPSTRLCRYRL